MLYCAIIRGLMVRNAGMNYENLKGGIMSRYNEDEWQRIKDAQREREKLKHRNKLLGKGKEPFIPKQENELITYKHEVKVKRPALEKETHIIVISTFCIIAIMGCWFLFSGFSNNFFYEKTKEDLKLGATSVSQVLNSKIKKNPIPIKKWKRTTWETLNGKSCSNGKCLYVVQFHWRDCSLKTGDCTTKTKNYTRKSNRLNPLKISYL